MARECYVWRNGTFVPKHLAGPRPGVHGDNSKRADFATPYVVRDVPAYRSMKTGEMIEGRMAHREHLKRHDLVELGNEMPKLETRQERVARLRGSDNERKAMIAEAYDQVAQGMPHAPEEVVSASDFGLTSIPDNGSVIRSDAPVPDTAQAA